MIWVGVFLVVVFGFIWLTHRMLRCFERANGADWGGRRLNAIDGMLRLFCLRFHRMKADALPLPPGGAIVVANHVSGLDPLLIIASSSRPLRFLIAREQYERPGLRWLFRLAGCIPVERSGQPELAFRTAMQMLRRGEVVAVFPEGGIHLPGQGPARVKSGALRLAYMSGVPIIPLYIDGVCGVGRTLPALIMRSRVRVRVYPALWCEKDTMDECLITMRRCIEGREH